MKLRSKLFGLLGLAALAFSSPVKGSIADVVTAGKSIPGVVEVNTLQFGSSACVLNNALNPKGYTGTTLIDTIPSTNPVAYNFIQFIERPGNLGNLEVIYQGDTAIINSQTLDSDAYKLIVQNPGFPANIVNVAPQLINPAGVTYICVNGGQKEIADSSNFTDANGDVLMYDVASSDTNIVSIFKIGGQVFATPKGVGTAIVSYRARDGNGAQVTDKISVNVTGIANITGTELSDSITDVTLPINSGVINLGALRDYFSSIGSDSVNYIVSVSDSAVLSAYISGDSLYVHPLNPGNAFMTVSTTGFYDACVNPASTTANQNVDVAINPITGIENRLTDESRLSVYPNPARDMINVTGTPKATYDATYDIFNLMGKEVKSTNELPIDLSGMPSGIYIIKGKEGTAKFIKE